MTPPISKSSPVCYEELSSISKPAEEPAGAAVVGDPEDISERDGLCPADLKAPYAQRLFAEEKVKSVGAPVAPPPSSPPSSSSTSSVIVEGIYALLGGVSFLYRIFS